ncbi:type I DNA topoisomerase [bacterium]|nr:type I DNA topoisomerase [bacterium]
MGKSLVIVESDAKSKTINRFLGSKFVVKASVGHIKNLPKNRLGVDIDNGYEPEYITIRGRGKIVKELKRLAGNADTIYIATDPDREGEAIAYHLASEISSSNTNIKRILFYEITKQAVRDAIEKPLAINEQVVEAQKARRVMDRIVGYQVSPFLWKTVYRGLSAGRVQSVALRLICERDEEIEAFKSEEYWQVGAIFNTPAGESFKSRLAKIKGKDPKLPDEATVKTHVAAIESETFTVSDIRTKRQERNPLPPYITSTMQQDAARKLNMSTKRIMSVAQELYEGIDLPEGRVGLITYMRTDSTRMAMTSVEEAREHIAESYGTEYVPAKPRIYKTKKSAQDAHEAIRPTSARRTPKALASYLSPAQLKLYTLIWNRFVACQMASAKVDMHALELTGGDYLFRTTGSEIIFRGFLQLYDMEKDADAGVILPVVKKNDTLDLQEVLPTQHFTKPPARFTESSLVKVLDQLGIGRPSTYALIITTLLLRKYIEKEARSLQGTDLGRAVYKILLQHFPNIFDVSFTAEMENELDQIESGEKDKKSVLDDFYTPFSKAMTAAMEKRDEIKESLQEGTDEQCPDCGKDLVVKWGRNGQFIACSGYPDCKYTKPLEEEVLETDEICDVCGASMVVKNGRFGRFLACSNYPKCKTTKAISTNVQCPEPDCQGTVVERQSKRGKLFFGCSAYPKCKFATWYRPVPVQCTSCANPYMEERQSKAKGAFRQCPKCKHTETLPSKE